MRDATATFELKETSHWLRYVFWAGALALLYLMAVRLASPEIDRVAVVCLALGVLLLGFSGFVLEERRIIVDPTTRTISIRRRGFRRRSVETIPFTEIRRLSVVAVPTTWEDSNGRSRPDTGWSAVIVLGDRSLPLNVSPCVSREQALKLAEAVALRTSSPIAASESDAIDLLLGSGRVVDAVAALAREQNLSLPDARAEIDRRLTARTSDRPDARPPSR